MLDGDDDGAGLPEPTDAMRWYLDQLERLVPRGDAAASISHPKMAATVHRALDLWRSGEKVVVFCHYVATGKVLRQRISEAIDREIMNMGSHKLGCMPDEANEQLERIGKRFFDEDSPIRRACDASAKDLLGAFPTLIDCTDELVEIVRRNVRTPSFLVRFFPLDKPLGEDAMKTALETRDSSGQCLRDLLKEFFKFLVTHCGDEERRRYIDAVRNVQTGAHSGKDTSGAFASNLHQGDHLARLLPNVGLVNGTTDSETRQRWMLTFNTPFYPEILVASNVLAEGVDLHLNCRHVIHHDLCWNPSTLEQRTGRVDRIGAKTERCGKSIQLYLPFIAETQDEKMYRVVTDRQRWFSVVMGEKYAVNARTVEKLAKRIPFPEAAAKELAFRLEVVQPE
jgi:ERCC4-related helicase